MLCCLPFLGTSWPPPHCCFIALLLALTPYCSTLSIVAPSSFFCAGGRAWSNTNKIHPTIEVFFSLDFLSLLSLLCILFICFVFVYHFCFELNNFVLM
jgi:hypothetical protein